MSSELYQIELGEIGEFKNGANFSQDDYGPGYPIVNVKQLYGGRYIDLHNLESLGKDVLKRPEQLFLEEGDILFARSSVKRSGAGQCAMVPCGVKQTIFSGFIIRFRLSDKSKTNPLFLTYLLQSPEYREIFSRIATGTTISNLSQEALRKIPVRLPSKIFQDEAAGILGILDDRITLLRETNATLEAIAQALFKSWFVDFDPVHAKRQGRTPEGMDEFTAMLFPDSFEESELGLVPKGWRVSKVGQEVVTVDYVANGSFASLKKNVTLSSESGFAIYVRTTDYNSGFKGDFRYVDKSAYDFLSKSSLVGDEVIISNVGDVGTVFRPPVWLGLPMTLGSNAVALKNSKISAYLFYLFKNEQGQHAIKSIVTGSAQLKFNKTNLRSLPLLIPTEGILEKFEDLVGNLLATIDSNQGQAYALTQLRDTLLPRLISGQLRLPEAELGIEEALACAC